MTTHSRTHKCCVLRLSEWQNFLIALKRCASFAAGVVYVNASVLIFASPAHANLTTAKPKMIALSLSELDARWPKLHTKQKIIALLQIIKLGRFELAQRYLDNTNFSGGSKVDARYIQALIFRNTERLDEAATLFRGILAKYPDNQPARYQLAQTLYLMKEDESAKHHFELALGSVTNRNLEKNIRNFIDQIDRRRRWNFSAYLSLAPSTNFNQGTEARFVYLNGLPFKISDASKAKSGIGITGGLNAGYRFALSDRLDFITGVGVNFKEYADEAFDDLLISTEVGPRYSFSFGHIGIYATLNRRWVAGQHYADSVGARLKFGGRFSKRGLASITLGASQNRFQFTKYFDGTSYFATGYVDYFLTGGSFFRALGGAAKQETGLEHLSHVSWHGGLGYYVELPWGLSVYTQVKLTHKQYEGLFPGITEARDDLQADITASLTKRDWDWMGFAPKLEYGFTKNASNVVFYEYESHSANLTLTKKF